MKSTTISAIKSSIDWGRDEPPIKFPIRIAECDAIEPHILGQQTLITGSPGSGKTASLLLPCAKGVLSYHLPGSLITGGLVIDPKHELGMELEKVPALQRRIRYLSRTTAGSCEFTTPARLNLYEFEPHSNLRERVAKLSSLTLRVTGGEAEKWLAMGWEYLSGLLNLQKGFRDAGSLKGLSIDFLGHVNDGIEKGLKAQEVVQRMLFPEHEDQVLKSRSSLEIIKQFMDLTGGSQKRLQFVSSVFAAVNLAEGSNLINPFDVYGANDDTAAQTTYFKQSVGPALSLLTDPVLNSLLDVDPLGLPDTQQHRYLSMSRFLDEGNILVYQPERDSQSDKLLGQILKSHYTSYIQQRADILQPQALIIDEWHRYVTPEDMTFLSFCRSYRVIVLLATQTVQAITAALSNANCRDAVITTEAILGNLSMRFWLRSNDAATQKNAQCVFPFEMSSERPHVLAVRPLTTLQTGEYYYAMPDGKRGRTTAVLAPKQVMRPPLQPDCTASKTTPVKKKNHFRV